MNNVIISRKFNSLACLAYRDWNHSVTHSLYPILFFCLDHVGFFIPFLIGGLCVQRDNFHVFFVILTT